jgi:hypothetical protein
VQRSERLVDRHLGHLHPALGVRQLEGLDDPRHLRHRRIGEHAQAQRGGRVTADRLRALEGFGEQRVRAADLVADLSAQGGQLDPPARASDQIGAELGLELAHDLAHTRGGQMKPLGRAAEVKLLGEHEEHADLTELDRRPHRRMDCTERRRLIAKGIAASR